MVDVENCFLNDAGQMVGYTVNLFHLFWIELLVRNGYRVDDSGVQGGFAKKSRKWPKMD